jgi:hypothetical protein
MATYLGGTASTYSGINFMRISNTASKILIKSHFMRKVWCDDHDDTIM